MSPTREPQDENGRPLNVGGQAVLEGVMMRSPWRIATAVRDNEGAIRVKARPFTSATKRHKVLGWPVLRGMVGLYEAMKIGFDSLNWSGEIAEEGEEREPGFWDRLLEAVSPLLAVAFALGLFMAVPYAVAGLIPRSGNPYLFHLVAGSLRITLLIAYMAGISLIPDIKRVFRYHGAEHKSIFAFEKGYELTRGTACGESRFHPRCGTSFLLLAAILTMIGFALFDAAWTTWVGEFPTMWHRILIHLPAIPIVAGLSYEVLRLVERNSEKKAWRPLVTPGFWLQRITTREPDGEQVEVALAALRESLRRDEDDYEGQARTEEVADPMEARPDEEPLEPAAPVA